jgi:hypothetical protein
MVRLLHVDLHESAGELLFFPRCRRLACAKTHEQILPAHRLAGMQSHILDDAVALVEHADDGDTLRHGRHAGLVPGSARRALRHRRICVLPLLRTRTGRGGER